MYEFVLKLSLYLFFDYHLKAYKTNVTMDTNLINIDGSTDSYYRYKRSKLTIQHITGNRTRIDNIKTLSKELSRPSDEVMKVLSILCNTQIVNTNCLQGQYSVEILEQKLQKYINECILCGKCNNPETIYFKKGNSVGKGCNACGKGTKITESKLSKYILKSLE